MPEELPIVSRETAGFPKVFHVKQLSHKMNKEILFSNTKIPEDHIEDILDVDPAK
jgi:hypothetical protein